MPRPTMTELIQYTRELIGDVGASQFSDDQIERALDVHRYFFRETLRPIFSYRRYESTEQFWDTGTTFGEHVPSLRKDITGYWEFPTDVYNIVAEGAVYDVFGAAADLLETWAASLSLDFDFSADGATMQRSQKAKALRETANVYRKQQRVRTINVRP